VLPTSWIGAFLSSISRAAGAGSVCRAGLRYLSHYTGLPALLIAGVLVVVGYRILKRTARFALEVAVICGLLVAATELGWLSWGN